MKQISILLFLCISLIVAEPIAVQTFDYDTVTSHIPAGKTGDITVTGSRDEHDLYVDSTFIGREKVCLSLDTGTYTFRERIGDSLLYSKEMTFSYGDSYQVRFRRPRRLTFELTGGTGVHFARWTDGSMGVHPILFGELGFITKRNWHHAIKGTMPNSLILTYEKTKENGNYLGLSYTLQKLFRLSEIVEIETGVEVGGAGTSRWNVTLDTVDAVFFGSNEYQELDTTTADRFEYIGKISRRHQDFTFTPVGFSGKLTFGRDKYFLQAGYSLYLGIAQYREEYASSYFKTVTYARPVEESIDDLMEEYRRLEFFLLDENGDTYDPSEYTFPDPVTKFRLAHSLSIAFVVRF